MMKRRAVITGMGTINPLGDTLEGYYQNLIAGKSGIRRWKSLDMSKIECKIGGDLGDYDCLAALERFKDVLGPDTFKKAKKMFRSTTFSAKMSILCTLAAWQDAGLSLSQDSADRRAVDPYRTSVIVGGHNLNSNYIHENSKRFLEDVEYLDPLSGVEGIDPNVPAVITEILGLHGPTFTIGGACASGNLALREGFRDIMSGESDTAVIAGGLFDMSPGDIQASVIINAVVVKPEYQDHPEKASRPFDADRAGFVYSHGAGTLMLEELEHALAPRRPDSRRSPRREGQCQRLSPARPRRRGPGAPDPRAARVHGYRPVGGGLRQLPRHGHARRGPGGDQGHQGGLRRARLPDEAERRQVHAGAHLLGVPHRGDHRRAPPDEARPAPSHDQHRPPGPRRWISTCCANGPVEHRIRCMLKNSFGFGGINACSLIRRYEG